MKHPISSPADDYASAIDAANHYLLWYGHAHRTADRVLVALQPRIALEILCTDGVCVPVEGPFQDTLCIVLGRAIKQAKIVVAAIERQKITEGIS